jgi:hypothetical protein
MIHLSEHDAARLGIGGAKPRTKRGRNTRPDIPSAPAGEGDRLEALRRIARYGFSPRWDADRGFCFWHPATGARTSTHATYAAACIAAEREMTS